jgi:flagellar biosynthesis/type III secretory pathway protein FliH
MGKEDGNRLGYIEGRSARIDEFRKMMASVMEELDMIPNEDCGIGF